MTIGGFSFFGMDYVLNPMLQVLYRNIDHKVIFMYLVRNMHIRKCAFYIISKQAIVPITIVYLFQLYIIMKQKIFLMG